MFACLCVTPCVSTDLASLAVALDSCNTFRVAVYTGKEMFMLDEILRG